MAEPTGATHLDDLAAYLAARYPIFGDVVDRGFAAFGTPWANEFEATLATMFAKPEALSLAASGYASFALDLMRRQVRFERERTYPAKTYEEAAREVYHDEAYMTSEYLPGLLLSHYLWPHHYRQARFFDSAFVAEMRVAQASHFIEVGCGTGFYSRRLLQQLPDIRGVGYEISPASKAFTEGQVAAFGFADRYEVLLQDIADRDMASTQWLVCVEVLEHLEDPVAFLRLLRASLAPGGKAFITAALNAPHVDHIYLYVQSAEVEAQLEAAGFTLEQTFVGVAHPPRAPGLPVPLVAAYIVA